MTAAEETVAANVRAVRRFAAFINNHSRSRRARWPRGRSSNCSRPVRLPTSCRGSRRGFATRTTSARSAPSIMVWSSSRPPAAGPLGSWTESAAIPGGRPPLAMREFELRLSDVAWSEVRAEPARRWLDRVLEAVHAGVTAEVANRSARVDATVSQAIIEANDRCRRRVLDQFAEADVARADSTRGDRLVAESTALRDWIRQMDPVFLRIRKARFEDAEIALAAEEVRPRHR